MHLVNVGAIALLVLLLLHVSILCSASDVRPYSLERKATIFWWPLKRCSVFLFSSGFRRLNLKLLSSWLVQMWSTGSKTGSFISTSTCCRSPTFIPLYSSTFIPLLLAPFQDFEYSLPFGLNKNSGNQDGYCGQAHIRFQNTFSNDGVFDLGYLKHFMFGWNFYILIQLFAQNTDWGIVGGLCNNIGLRQWDVTGLQRLPFILTDKWNRSACQQYKASISRLSELRP